MSDGQVRVTFEPSGRSVTVLAGTKVLEAAGRVGLVVETPCGGQGVCGKCRVRITHGAGTPTPADRAKFSQQELDEGWRLACQSRMLHDAVVHVPDTSLFGSSHQILAERQKGLAANVQPAVRKVYVEMPEPTLADDRADLVRLEEALRSHVKVDLDLLRRLPLLMRHTNFKGTAVLTDHHLIDFEPGDTTARCFGMAFDVGTTTIVGSLLDLSTGRELALASGMNPQVSFGDDVLSRIKHSGSCEGCLDELRKSVIAAVIGMIDECCREAKISRREIYEISFAGNTTMQHLLCGIDASQLGQVPFVPVFGRGLLLRAADMDLPIHPAGCAYIFPVIGGFVGGDTVAGILSSGMAAMDGPVLLVDIGTNGEIVLAHDGKLVSSSTAAGPAFEGARISCGMRATGGAIEKVMFDGDVHLSTIANTKPIGLCGSGLIDLAAELLRTGIVSPEGRLLPPDELAAEIKPALRSRVGEANGQVTFTLDSSGEGRQLVINQRDIRELQLATGAIKAGIRILLKHAGLKTSDLKRVMIAGGFGSFIRRNNAQRIGLLPTDVHHEKISYVGNTSLEGAKWALLSTNLRREAEDLARRTRHMELSQDMDFQMEFAEAMIFPES